MKTGYFMNSWFKTLRNGDIIRVGVLPPGYVNFDVYGGKWFPLSMSDLGTALNCKSATEVKQFLTQRHIEGVTL